MPCLPYGSRVFHQEAECRQDHAWNSCKMERRSPAKRTLHRASEKVADGAAEWNRREEPGKNQTAAGRRK